MRAMITHEGKDYAVGDYQVLKEGDYFLDAHGVRQYHNYNPLGQSTGAHRLVMLPIPTHHVFGTLTFEETGEVRIAEDEWVMATDLDTGTPTPAFVTGRSDKERIIIREIH